MIHLPLVIFVLRTVVFLVNGTMLCGIIFFFFQTITELNTVKLGMVFSRLMVSDCCQTHPDMFPQPQVMLRTSVPAGSLTSTLISVIRRTVRMMSLSPALLQLLSVMRHNADVGLHLCFLCAAKIYPLLKPCDFLFTILNSMLRQGSCSN